MLFVQFGFCFQNASEQPKDVGKLVRGEMQHLNVHVPLSAICLVKPDDMPCVEDWLTTCLSFLFSGSRLYREPLDLNVAHRLPDDPSSVPFLHVKKGFTRLFLGFALHVFCFVCVRTLF